jgi:long-chain fatty acid transport protein
LKRILILTAIFCFTAASAYAGCVETFGIGAKETAQGKAVAAQADTPFAVYYNPAGLTQIEGPTFSAGAVFYEAEVSSKLKVIDPSTGKEINNGWDNDNETDNDTLVNPSIGYAMPITDKLSFGVAAYSPYGLTLESSKNPYENPISFFAWESHYVRVAVTPTIAYKLSDKLSFGFGVSLGQSECNAGRTYIANPFKMKVGKAATDAYKTGKIDTNTYAMAMDVLDLKGDATAPNGSHLNKVELETDDDFNYSWNAGVLFNPTDKLSLGLTYRSRTSADFEGDILFNGKTVGSIQMDYDHPEQVQGGIRYAFSDKFSVEFDLTWTRWAINENQTERMAYDKDAVLSSLNLNMNDPRVAAILSSPLVQGMLANPSFTNSTTVYPRRWDNTMQYQIGAEWLVNEKLALRTGFVYDPTPVPDTTFDQGWPDTDRSLFNLGFGYKFTEKWEIDGVLQYIRSIPRRDIHGNSENLNHVFSGEVVQKDVDVYVKNNKGVLYGLGFTVSYKF